MLDNDPNRPDFATWPDSVTDVDALLDALSDSRRQCVLACLRDRATPVALADLAEEVAARELDEEPSGVPAEVARSVHVSLYHVHVPKMADAGIVDYDRDDGVVELAETGDRVTSIVGLHSVG